MGGSGAPSLREPSEPSAWQAPAIWRRGMMHAVERLDRVLGPRDRIPRKAADRLAMFEAIHEELDRIAAFARHEAPRNYDEAFALCERALAEQKARKDGSTQQGAALLKALPKNENPNG